MEISVKQIYDKFLEAMEQNNESAARQLLIDNIPNFPQELQDEIMFGLFEEDVLRAAKEGEMIAKMQEQGLQNLEALVRVQKKIEDQLKINELNKKLSE